GLYPGRRAVISATVALDDPGVPHDRDLLAYRPGLLRRRPARRPDPGLADRGGHTGSHTDRDRPLAPAPAKPPSGIPGSADPRLAADAMAGRPPAAGAGPRARGLRQGRLRGDHDQRPAEVGHRRPDGRPL